MSGKHLKFCSAVLAVVFALGGCVSKSTYEKLEADKNQEIATLRTERLELQRQRAQLQEEVSKLDVQRAGLEEQKAQLERESVGLQTRLGLLANDKQALEQEKQRLETERAALVQRQNDLRQEVGGLEQQKARLLANSRQTQTEYDSLVQKLTDEVKQGQLKVRRFKTMLTVEVAEQLFFDSGSATLKESGQRVLKKLGETLRTYDDKLVRVVGHTDNVPIAKALQEKYASNWDLSAARATTVVRFLQDSGVPAERLIVSARAQYAPIAGNDTPEGRKQNRRIEIMLIERSQEQETNPVSN